MSFWEQFLIAEASSALHALFAQYASKYFTAPENAAFETVFAALADLPRRIHTGTAKVAPIPLKGK